MGKIRSREELLSNIIKQANNIGDITSSRHCLTYDVNSTIEDVVQAMHTQHQGAVGVLDIDGNFVGFLTERDILRKIFGTLGESSSEYNDRQQDISLYPGKLLTKDVMIKNPVYLTEDIAVEEALDTIREHGFRFMPVVKKNDNNKLLGIIDEHELLWHSQKMIKEELNKFSWLSYFISEPYCAGRNKQYN